MNKIKLRVKWSKKENDFMIYYPRSCDGHFIYQLVKKWIMIHPTSLIDSFLSKSTKEASHYRGSLGKYSLLETDWIQDLEERGYDKTTLKFEISISRHQLKAKFPHIYDSLSKEEKEKLGID